MCTRIAFREGQPHFIYPTYLFPLQPSHSLACDRISMQICRPLNDSSDLNPQPVSGFIFRALWAPGSSNHLFSPNRPRFGRWGLLARYFTTGSQLYNDLANFLALVPPSRHLIRPMPVLDSQLENICDVPTVWRAGAPVRNRASGWENLSIMFSPTPR